MKVSIVVPVYDMPNKEYFLNRCIDSIRGQTFTDYEIVMPENGGGWAKNHNQGITDSKGDLIKFLHMDDYFSAPDSLENIVKEFEGGWMVTGCVHIQGDVLINKHNPEWNDQIVNGVNTIGGPSVLIIENKDPILFDEELTWLVDCDYYQRLFNIHGPPKLLNQMSVVIGLGSHQATNLIEDERKLWEHKYMRKKYGI